MTMNFVRKIGFPPYEEKWVNEELFVIELYHAGRTVTNMVEDFLFFYEILSFTYFSFTDKMWRKVERTNDGLVWTIPHKDSACWQINTGVR